MNTRPIRLTTSFRLITLLLVAAVIALAANSSQAWELYNQGCNHCHGGFFSGSSPKGTVFPSDNKHEMHISEDYMDSACNLCHGGQGVMYLASSGGTSSNPGVGCVGCHGREYPTGHRGLGLQKLHVTSGVTSCNDCHLTDMQPKPEGVLPIYYGTPDTNVDDPCNSAPDFLENWSIGDTVGLDNDGDGTFDSDDGDCAMCAADITGDDVVDVLDLLEVLAQWGTSGSADITGDGIVNVLDLVEVLSAWGPCP